LRENLDVNDPLFDSGELQTNDFVGYNNNMPLIFIGGVPRSGTTLMRAMLDAHPLVRCGEETRIVPRIIYMRNQWKNSKKEAERLTNAGITDDIIDSAVGSFILEVIVKHGKPADYLCNKDPLVLR
jgi:protein-tyrosine sulfotransferase